MHVPVYPASYFLSLETFGQNACSLIIKAILVKKMSALLFIDGLILRMPIAMQPKTPL